MSNGGSFDPAVDVKNNSIGCESGFVRNCGLALSGYKERCQGLFIVARLARRWTAYTATFRMAVAANKRPYLVGS